MTDLQLQILLGLAIAVAVPVWLIAASWLFASRSPSPRVLEPSAPVRLFRWYRSLWARAIATLAGWPHIVDVALGTRGAGVGATAAQLVWSEPGAALYRYESSRTRDTVLVVHSLISKPWILDLTEDRSFMGALCAEGFDVFLLDWADFGEEHAAFGFADLLMRAEQRALALSEAEKVHLVGYCLGGTLCLARAAARRHDSVASLSLLAAPLDFAVPSTLQLILTHPLLKPTFFLDGSSCVPAPVVREAFHVLRPQAIRTVLAGFRSRGDPGFRRTYGALARWVWEHRRLPGALWLDLVELFRSNSLFHEGFTVAGEVARMSDVRVPIAMFVAERDHIVPSGSSHAVTSVGGLDAEVITTASGHVSMMCGSGAKDVMWPRLIEWLDRHGGA